MKRVIAVLVAVFFVAQSVVLAPRAEATVGVILYATKHQKAGIPLMIAGGVGILPGAPIAGLIAAAAYTPAIGAGLVLTSAGLVGVGAGIFVALIGLVILDTGSQGDLAYATVTDAEAGALGMTAAEQSAYNAELPEINTIRESVRYDVTRDKHPSFGLASSVWESYSGELSSDAYQGLKKVSEGIRQAAAIR